MEGGFTRWTFTGADGRYTLRSLTDGPRTVAASKSGITFASERVSVTVAGEHIRGIDFRGSPSND